MKWTFQFQNKLKTALLFFVVMITLLGSTLLEEHYMAELDESVSSIYKDRLMPEASLLLIQHHLFNRRLLLERYLHTPTADNRSLAISQGEGHDQQIDSLIRAFELTYLVPEEVRLLKQIRQKIGTYRQLEHMELQTLQEGKSASSYERQAIPVFNDLNDDLLAMSLVQTEVGAHLYHDSRVTKSSAWTIGHLQIAIVIGIAVAVQALLFSSRSIVPKKFQRHQWN